MRQNRVTLSTTSGDVTSRAALGLVWTLVESDNAQGLAMSPAGESVRTLP